MSQGVVKWTFVVLISLIIVIVEEYHKYSHDDVQKRNLTIDYYCQANYLAGLSPLFLTKKVVNLYCFLFSGEL